MMRVYVEGIGLCGPGLTNWNTARPILTGEQSYHDAPMVVPPLTILAATERRRTVPTVRLALAVGLEALANAGRDPATLATVFASSGGDGETVHAILETLASDARDVSPTRFHNSVHNAPSGYWNIGTGSREPTTSLCAHDFSFAAGLLDAAAQVTADRRPVLLIAYDVPYPEPLHAVRPLLAPFGVALVLADTAGTNCLVALDIDLAEGEATRMTDPELEAMCLGNPAARSLPLLQALADATAQQVTLDYRAGRAVTIGVSP